MAADKAAGRETTNDGPGKLGGSIEISGKSEYTTPENLVEERGNISDGGGQVKSGNPGISRIIIHK